MGVLNSCRSSDDGTSVCETKATGRGHTGVATEGKEGRCHLTAAISPATGNMHGLGPSPGVRCLGGQTAHSAAGAGKGEAGTTRSQRWVIQIIGIAGIFTYLCFGF